MIDFNRISYQMDTLIYDTETRSSNVLVTRVLWSCEDLPTGLTLSTDGKLSGIPTTTGIYNCNVQVSTNWGTATRTITIIVQIVQDAA